MLREGNHLKTDKEIIEKGMPVILSFGPGGIQKIVVVYRRAAVATAPLPGVPRHPIALVLSLAA